MNLKAFFVDALARALDLEIATADDVLRYVTPDVLATYLPRPLWARLLAACLGAMRVDAALVVETVGVPNLCEHVPAHILWACISDVARRSLGGTTMETWDATRVTTRPSPVQIAPPPPENPTPAIAPKAKSGPVITVPTRAIPPVSQPMADIHDDLDAERPVAQQQPRASLQPRFRQAGTASGRQVAATPTVVSTVSRRPQAVAPVPAARSARRGATEMETETDVSEISVDDSQLVDWQTSEDTQTAHDDRKR